MESLKIFYGMLKQKNTEFLGGVFIGMKLHKKLVVMPYLLDAGSTF